MTTGGAQARADAPAQALRLGSGEGRLPADAPLVETPARNLPPVEYRDNPHYYCPKV